MFITYTPKSQSWLREQKQGLAVCHKKKKNSSHPSAAFQRPTHVKVSQRPRAALLYSALLPLSLHLLSSPLLSFPLLSRGIWLRHVCRKPVKAMKPQLQASAVTRSKTHFQPCSGVFMRHTNSKTHTHTHTHSRAHTCTHTYTHTRSHTHAATHTVNTNTYTQCAQTHSHKKAHTRYAHACIHKTRTGAHI